jgi:uncharacterized protein (DUF305 family)
MKQSIRCFIVLTILLTLAGLGLMACAASQQETAPSPTAAPTPAAEQAEHEMIAEDAMAEAEFDQMFIDMMVPHHQGAVEMAQIALERAEHPEIQQLAEAVIKAQEAEIEQMRQWRQEWYGSSQTPSMSEMPALHAMPEMGEAGHAMDMADEVERLRNAPEPFDQAFIEAMIPHHQSAIDAGRLAEQQATRPEIKELAQAIIEDQQREIDQMNQWLQDWYGGEAEATPAP